MSRLFANAHSARGWCRSPARIAQFRFKYLFFVFSLCLRAFVVVTLQCFAIFAIYCDVGQVVFCSAKG